MIRNQASVGRMLGHIAAGLLLIIVSTTVRADNLSSSLTFDSQNQSMWGTGPALQYDTINNPTFYGFDWDERGSVGGFIGGDTQIINPLWAAWYICPFLCGSEPTKYFTVDTSTGLQVSATTQGRIGFELGLKIDSGSVDATVGYTTNVVTPEPGTIDPGQFISLNTVSDLTGDSIASQFPTLEASLGVVMEVSATFAATGCAVGACDSVSFGTGTLGGSQELVAFNKDGEGGITYFGGEGILSDIVDTAIAAGLIDLPTGFPAVIEIPAPGLGNIATITAHLPEPNTSGGLNSAGTMLTSQGQDDLLDVSFDIDNIISIASIGVGGLFGGSQDLGLGFSVGYDLINVEMGPQIDLVQSFEFTPTLFVDLEFSQPVNVTGYGMVSSLNGLAWDLLPTIAFDGGSTIVTPTFYLGTLINGDFFDNAGELYNQLFLDIDGNIKVDLLTATFGTPFGDETIGIGNLINQSFDLFTTPAMFSRRFAMEGFAPIIGESFSVVVPEPGMLLLFGSGLLLLSVGARRRRMLH